jgi:hypothetical protein
MSPKSSRHQEIVKRLLDTKAVDFNAIGKIVAEVGPSLAVADEPWEEFCGTMRHFIRLFRINPPIGPIEDLGELSGAANLK